MKPSGKMDIVKFLQLNRDVLIGFGVRQIGIFGSFARNSQKENSDIDLLVQFDEDKLNYSNYINLAYYLEDNLSTKIDLLTIDSLSPHIAPRILQEVEYVSI